MKNLLGRRNNPCHISSRKLLFQNKMPEMNLKCKYHNSGYCKYQSKCLYFHPSEECDKKCEQKKCMKRHIKPCRYKTTCKHKEKCAYKHTEPKTVITKSDTIAVLEKTVKELLDYKKKSEFQITSLIKELNSLKARKTGKNVNADDIGETSKTNKLQQDLNELKSEFDNFKIIQRNQSTKKIEVDKQGNKLNSLKCKFCNLTYQTKNGLKVHVDLEHENKLIEDETFKCKHCIITCSDQEVLRKHMKREHTMKCDKCSTTFEEQINFENHMKTIHNYSFTKAKKIQ